MTGKTVEDLFLADDVRSLTPDIATALDGAVTHDDVLRILRPIVDLIVGLGVRDVVPS